MSLNNPQSRSALRAIIFAVVMLVRTPGNVCLP